MGKEQPARYYDTAYAGSMSYSKPFNHSYYYPMWKKIMAGSPNLPGIGPTSSVLDLGCGPGQFAQAAYHHGISRYLGIDFSKTACQMAQKALYSIIQDRETNYTIMHHDLFTVDYKALAAGLPDIHVTCLETLEHLTNDQALVTQLSKSLPGRPITITVPSFDDVSHVRYFRDLKSISDRYSPLLQDFKVEVFSKWFIITGQL